jgi:hypothetical protein
MVKAPRSARWPRPQCSRYDSKVMDCVAPFEAALRQMAIFLSMPGRPRAILLLVSWFCKSITLSAVQRPAGLEMRQKEAGIGRHPCPVL